MLNQAPEAAVSMLGNFKNAPRYTAYCHNGSDQRDKHPFVGSVEGYIEKHASRPRYHLTPVSLPASDSPMIVLSTAPYFALETPSDLTMLLAGATGLMCSGETVSPFEVTMYTLGRMKSFDLTGLVKKVEPTLRRFMKATVLVPLGVARFLEAAFFAAGFFCATLDFGFALALGFANDFDFFFLTDFVLALRFDI